MELSSFCNKLFKFDSYYTTFIGLGIDINAKTNSQETALSFAVMSGNLDHVQILLQYKANPNIKNKENKTAIDYANLYSKAQEFT